MEDEGQESEIDEEEEEEEQEEKFGESSEENSSSDEEEKLQSKSVKVVSLKARVKEE